MIRFKVKLLLHCHFIISILKGGVLFNAHPPNKRFAYYLDQLSGGEKTIAGLALLFSIGLVK